MYQYYVNNQKYLAYKNNEKLLKYFNASLVEVLIDGQNEYFFAFMCLVIGLTIFLNMFIVVSVFTDKSMRNYTNIQFASMSIADTLVGSLAMPFMLVNTLYTYWPYDEALCILWCVADFVGGNVSILTLTIISYHRLKCIRNPFKMTNKKTTRQSLVPVLLVWPITFCYWTIPIVLMINRDPVVSTASDTSAEGVSTTRAAPHPTKDYLYYYHYDFNRSQGLRSQAAPSSSFYDSLVSPKNCYFMYSVYYVLPADLFGYIIPAILLIYFQINIYRLLNVSKKRLLLTSTKVSSKSGKENAATPHVSSIFGSKKSKQVQRRRSSFGELEKARRRLTKAHAEQKGLVAQIGGGGCSGPNARRFLPHIFQLPGHRWSTSNQPSQPVGELAAIRESLQPMLAPAVFERQPSVPDSPMSVGEGVVTTLAGMSEEQLNSYHNQFTLSASQRKSLTAPNELIKFRLLNASRSMSQQLTHANYSISTFTKNKKVFRTLLCVTFSLFVLWTPWIVSWPIEAYCHCIPDQLYSFTYWMEYMNSFANPIILIVGNTHFRTKFIGLFKRPLVCLGLAKSSQRRIGPNMRLQALSRLTAKPAPGAGGGQMRISSAKHAKRPSNQLTAF